MSGAGVWTAQQGVANCAGAAPAAGSDDDKVKTWVVIVVSCVTFAAGAQRDVRSLLRLVSSLTQLFCVVLPGVAFVLLVNFCRSDSRSKRGELLEH